SLSHGATAHSPGNVTVALSWLNDSAPASPVVFTPSSGLGSFTPSTITLGSTGTYTGAATLTVPSTQSGSHTIRLTNDDGLRTLSATFDMVDIQAEIDWASARSGILPGGNILCLFLTDTDGNDTPVIGCDPTGCTVTLNGGSPISLGPAIYTGSG